MNVLFLTHRLPYAPNRGDRIRAFHIVEMLSRYVQLDVAALTHDLEEQAAVAPMRARGLQVVGLPVPRMRNYARAIPRLLGRTPLTHMLLDSPAASAALTRIVADRPPDVVLAFCSSMARLAVEPPLDRFPLVLDLVDVDSAKWAALAERASGWRRWVYQREARLLAPFERQVAERARATFVVNDRELELVRQLAPTANAHALPNGVDVGGLRPPGAPLDRPRVTFCGVMNYEPNVEGVSWFCREIWPLVRRQRPDAEFFVVGSQPAAAIRALASAASGIHVTGTVDDVRPFLWESAVSVAPLRVARGVQTKVLEAVAAGVPTVVTSAAERGLPAEIEGACRTADTAEGFAAHILALLAMPAHERRQLTAASNLTALAWEPRLLPLLEALRRAVR